MQSIYINETKSFLNQAQKWNTLKGLFARRSDRPEWDLTGPGFRAFSVTLVPALSLELVGGYEFLLSLLCSKISLCLCKKIKRKL